MNNESVNSSHRGKRCTHAAVARRRAMVMALIGMGSVPAAMAQQAPGPPQTRDCDEIRRQDFNNRADWINARIDCKHENVNVQLFGLVDQATGSDVELFTEKQKEHLTKARERAENARSRSKQAGSFKQLARKDKVECFVRELDDPNHPDNDGNNDGVCITQGPNRENCLEVLGDQIGNDDGVCRGNEVCVQTCDQAAIDADDGNFDEAAAADVEQGLTDVEGVLQETNRQVAARIQLMALAKPNARGTVSGANDCLTLLLGTRQFDFATLEGVQAGANVASLAYDACDSACNQDVLGNNGSAVCVVLAVAAGILQTVSDAFQLQDDDVTGLRFDASMACMEQMDVELKDTLTRIAGVEAQLAALTEIVNRRFDEVVTLLNTPQGRRPGFPTRP